MSKKTLIIVAVIVLLTAIVSIILAVSRANKSSVVPSGEQPSATNNLPLASPGPIPSPSQLSSSDISKINTDPNPKDISDSKIIVKNGKDTAEINKAYQQYVGKNPAMKSEWAAVMTDAGQVVALDDFAKSVNLNIYTQLKELLMSFRYNLLSCNIQGKISRGVVFRVKLLPGYSGNLSRDETAFLKSWEKTMLRDTRPVVFPNVAFGEEQLNQPLSFKKGKYNYAEVNLPNGEKGSLNYAPVGDYIVISDSPACMDEVINQLDTPAQ